MQDKKRRGAALALAMLLALGAAACAPGNGEESSAPESVKTEASGGEKLPPLEITAVLTMYETPPDTEGEYWRDMEERYNIDYQPEWVPVTSYVDRLSLLVSTNDLPDVIRVEQVTAPWTVKAAEAGMFKDLTDYLKPEDYPNLCALNPAAWTNSKYKGRNYLFPNSRGQYNNCYFLRGDLLEKYGLSRPETVDELTAYFEAIAQEPGMVPVPSNLDSPIELVQAAFGPGNILPVYTDDGTGIVPFQLTESYAQAVEYMAKLYSKGLVSQEFALLNGDQTEDLMLSGKGGIYSKNAWHSYRINEEIKKVDSNGSFVPIFGLEGPGGTSVFYDMGYSGGLSVNSGLDEEKFLRWMDFMEQTCDPENYNYFYYGIEGVHYNIVDEFPALTEEGKKVVNNSFYIPFTLATATYTKVNSPLAPAAYNLAMQDTVQEVDTLAAKIDGAPFLIFNIISSPTWSDYWAQTQDEFNAFRADVVTGNKTIDAFRAYQQNLLESPEVAAATVEYKTSYDEFGLADWSTGG